MHVQRVFDALAQQEEPILVEREGKLYRLEPEGALSQEVMEPVQPLEEVLPPTPKRERGRYLRKDDPIFEIVDLGQAGHTDISEDKYRYFPEVFASRP